jgi:hypothetical protein
MKHPGTKPIAGTFPDFVLPIPSVLIFPIQKKLAVAD